MKTFVYCQTGELVLLGDKVRIRRFLRRSVIGTVTYVYDPSKPMPLKGDNEYGVNIDMGNRRHLWVDGELDKRIELIERSPSRAVG